MGDDLTRPEPTLPNPNVDIKTGRTPEEHKQWLHERGMMTHDEAARYHAFTGFIRGTLIIVFFAVLVYWALPALRWLLDLFVARWGMI
jgi:hypothetical protein